MDGDGSMEEQARRISAIRRRAAEYCPVPQAIVDVLEHPAQSMDDLNRAWDLIPRQTSEDIPQKYLAVAAKVKMAYVINGHYPFMVGKAMFNSFEDMLLRLKFRYRNPGDGWIGLFIQQVREYQDLLEAMDGMKVTASPSHQQPPDGETGT